VSGEAAAAGLDGVARQATIPHATANTLTVRKTR